MNPLPASIRRQTPESVQRKLSEMDESTRIAYQQEFARRCKSGVLAFVLLLAGFHYAYLGRVWLTLLFLLSFGGLGIWWFADLFRVGGMVRERNSSIAIDVLRDIEFLR